MNAFYEHHQDSIRFGYRCFDRILLCMIKDVIGQYPYAFAPRMYA